MKRSISRRITKTASVMIILVLLIGGTIYLRTLSNAQDLDNRNLRELSRIGQGVEGRVNNLRRVLKSLADDTTKNPKDGAMLIPYLSVNTTNATQTEITNILDTGNTAFRTDLAASALELFRSYEKRSTESANALRAEYDFGSLRPALSSEYMETIFLASENGSIFIWESERTGARIHELTALDTLHFKDNGDTGGIGKSEILQIQIAGQDYRLYLIPIRIHLSDIDAGRSANSEYTNWILGGIVSQSEYRQQSLSLDPNMALFLGFLVIAGFLLVPFVRIFTMGPKERLRVGNLLYLVIALIFGTGLTGLWLADVVHFSPFKESIRDQIKKTANTVAFNLDSELQIAIQELRKNTERLDEQIGGINGSIDILDNTDQGSILMRDNIPIDPSGTYPFYHMVFWTDSAGTQIAKWTPRANNTPRIPVAQRNYFQTIQNDRGWNQKFQSNPHSTTCDTVPAPITGTLPYYIESIRSWTTGENLAVISMPWAYKDGTNEENTGIAAITTVLASITHPVLPAGVGLAVVDADAQTLFHTRPERILDENFAEETSDGNLIRSVLASRSCKELELNYDGKSKLMVIRPLNERPLFLILFKDLSLIDTVRFEAWFEGGILFGLWIFMILALIFLLERMPSSRMDWLWPDLEKPGKYTVFTLYSLPFIALFINKALTEEHLHIHPAILLIPALYLGPGLVIFSRGIPAVSNGYKSLMGWLLFVVSVLVLIWLSLQNGFETTLHVFSAMIAGLAILLIWLNSSRLQKYIERWSTDLSPRWVYTAAMVSGLLVLGLLPGYLTYRFTFHDHSEHLVKYHQLELAESLQTRKSRMDALMQSTWKIDNRRELSTPLRGISDPTYDQAFENLIFETTRQGPVILPENKTPHDTDLHNSMHDLFGDHIPFLTGASISMRQLSSEQADRKWVLDPENHFLQMSAGNQVPLTSRVPAAGSWLKPLRIVLLFFVTGLFCLIVYRVSRRVFFIHLEHSKPLTLEDVLPKPGESWRSTILVGTRSISRQPLLSRHPEVHYIDLITDVDDPGDIRELLKEPLPNETKVLCLDYFDHRIHEKERNRAVLELLEKNVTPYHALPVVLLTSRDPDESLLTDNLADEQKEEMKHRWDRVLGRFSKMILSDYVSDQPFKTLLRLRIIQKITGDMGHVAGKLNAILSKSHSTDNSTHFEELLAELALRTEWLRNELRKAASQTDMVRQNHPFADGNLQKLLEKTLQEIESLEIRIRREHTISENLSKWLNKLTHNAQKVKGLIRQIAAGVERKKPLPESNDTQKESSYRLFFKRISIWFLTGADMKAERLVYRDKKRIRKVYQTLLQECGHHERLQEIGEQLLYRPDWHTLTQEEIIDLVREGAEAHYRARWAILSGGERLIAAQLSRGAVVNPKSHQAITRLFARGLIKKSPELRLDNSSFSGFVQSTVSEDQLHSWERAGIPSTWEMIRGPLVVALIIVALFLFWSQREFLGNTIAFLGTIGVGVGAIFNLLSKMGHITDSPGLKNLEK